MRRLHGLRPLALLPTLLAAFLPGCGLRVRPAREPVSIPAQFSTPGTAGRAAEQARATPAPRWWRALHDPDLDHLVDAALAANQNLARAWQRLRQAGAEAALAGAGRFPTLDATVAGKRLLEQTRIGDNASAAGFGGGAPRTRTLRNVYSLGLAASWELDLWGRVRNYRRAALLRQQAAAADLRAAAISLAAEVATAWYRLKEARAQVALLREQLRTDATYLEAVRGRFNRGLVTAADVFQQEQVLEAARGDLANARARARIMRHGLAVLLGRAPGAAAIPAGADLPPAPALPGTGLPAHLLQARPDVRAAFMRMRAADHSLAAAVAERFPRLGLSADAGSTAAHVNEFFRSWVFNLAGNVLAPLLDGGRRGAQVADKRARAEELLHAYGQQVLAALREVEDALAHERGRRDHLASLQKQLALANKVMARTLEGYKNGTHDFVRFLTSQQSLQRLQRLELTARLDLLLARISLYRSLARDWQPPPPRAETGNEAAPPPLATDAFIDSIPGDDHVRP